MLYASLSIFVTLNFFYVNASAETLCYASSNQPDVLEANKGAKEKISRHRLRRAQYILNLRLKNRNRSHSLAPPIGQQRQSLHDKLSRITDTQHITNPDNT